MAEYIDRKTLIKDLKSLKQGLSPSAWDIVDAVIGRMNFVPAADVQEVKHGRWEMVEDFDGNRAFTQAYEI